MDISALLSSRARYRILEAFERLENPVGLRQLEHLTGLAIGSVQLTVQALIEESAVVRTADRYFRNPTWEGWVPLGEIFSTARLATLRWKAQRLNHRAEEVLHLCQDLSRMVRGAKRWT